MTIKERIKEVENRFETESALVEYLVDAFGYNPRSIHKVYRRMKGTLGQPSRPDQRVAKGLPPSVPHPTSGVRSTRKRGAPELTTMRTRKVSSVMDEENLNPLPKLINVCKQIPDGELVEPDDLRDYVGGISKTEWSRYFLKAAELTSFRCRIIKTGRHYFGNDREISKMKRKRGVE